MVAVVLKDRSHRFVVAGLFNTAVGLTLFPVAQTFLGPLGVHYLITLVGCHLASVTLSYFIGRYYVFHSEGPALRQYAFFSVFYWGYLVFNLMILPVLVEFSEFDPRVIQFGISLVAMISSYLWQKHIVFRGAEN